MKSAWPLKRNERKIIDKVVNITDGQLRKHFTRCNEERLSVIALADQLSDDRLESLSRLICNKSGRFLGYRTEAELNQLASVYNDIDAQVMLLEYAQLTVISPAWLRTDFVALQRLYRHDPKGYFVYTFFEISEQKWTDNSHAGQMDLLRLKAKMHFQLSRIDDFLLAEANELARRYLSLTSGSMGWPTFNRFVSKYDSLVSMFFTLDNVAQSDSQMRLYVEILKKSITKIITNHINNKSLARNKNKTVKLISAAALKEIAVKQKAESRWIKQKKLRKQTELDTLYLDLNEIFANVPNVPNIPKGQQRTSILGGLDKSGQAVKQSKGRFTLFSTPIPVAPTKPAEQDRLELIKQINEQKQTTESTLLNELDNFTPEFLSLDEIDDNNLQFETLRMGDII